MKVSIGKNTLGGGQKMTTELRNYNRSTHDLSQITRTTMAPGVLVPTLKLKMLPGDTFDIRTRCHTLTHPTVGPLFGSFKQQNDFFFCPDRLYQALIHNNALRIGMKMSQVKYPRITFDSTDGQGLERWSDEPMPGSGGSLKNQIHPSSLLAYLGFRGAKRELSQGGKYEWNATPILGYFDIFKNYYANKQEKNFFIVSGDNYIPYLETPVRPGSFSLNICEQDGPIAEVKIKLKNQGNEGYDPSPALQNSKLVLLIHKPDADTGTEGNIYINIALEYRVNTGGVEQPGELIANINLNGTISELKSRGWLEDCTMQGYDKVNYLSYYFTQTVFNHTTNRIVCNFKGTTTITLEGGRYKSYELEEIDNMREKILQTNKNNIFYADSIPFIKDLVKSVPMNNNTETYKPACANPMTGLCLKTYQSDINTNWVDTEWIEGENGINAITAIDTSSGSFTIDQMNLAQKVYTMLNRIAVSDGSYNAWIQTVYTSGGLNHIETPIYLGGSSLEIEFQEVINNSGSSDEPLGTLAGRGVATRHKGGNVYFKADEPGYLFCITSLTPRTDYFQGNDWDLYLDNVDELHKPQLDGIGFQDRLYRQLNANCNPDNLDLSIGKQPAWIEYMTNVNKTYGNFALIENEGWMCLNRVFGEIDTYTTYIQPHLYNNIFADTEITAQNFWVQIGFDIKARRVMSAKQIPNI